ncbi:MAG: F0F1 ATP synthase subunit B [Bacteroidales bacterium]
MELVKPGIGLLFWMTISFAIVLFILAKFAWKPILASLRQRESSIEDALKSAEQARKEMQNLQANNEKLLQEARQEKDAMLKEAKELGDKLIQEARTQAGVEAQKVLANAKASIEMERKAAVKELKAEVASLSVDIAEKLLQAQLQTDQQQRNLIVKMIDQAKLN